MRKLLIAAMTVLTISSSMAAEKKPLKDIDADTLTSDTQIMATGAGDQHVAVVWWIPNEFWQSLFARDETTSNADKNEVLDAMSGTSLLAVVQADITSMGAFIFYSKDEVEKKMLISFVNAGGERQGLRPMQAFDPNLEIVLGIFKPMLAAAVGNLGNNMHFFVLDDRSNSSLRLVDPYREGLISMQLAKRNGDLMTAEIEMPLNSLFVPRKCPNGNDAHVSWKYCPWSGERLKD